jgi:P4 family phage/plasmid primase-like protien
MSASFDTKAYCIQHQIPCFTFYMDASKRCDTPWKHIGPTNFKQELREYENGFAVITGFTHMVVDLDLKHAPPAEIQEALEAHCECIERTPGGYHYWFLYDDTVAGLKNKTEVFWDGVRIEGLDIRSKGGICYTAPAAYLSGGEHKQYLWWKGNLSCARAMPAAVLARLSNDAMPKNATVMPTVMPKDATNAPNEMLAILKGLSPLRADSYSQWIAVGMALKNSGYECAVWDDWSKQSTKYRSGECAKKWRGFTAQEKPVTIGTLYHWLKEDNYALFCSLQSKKRDVQVNLLAATHATVADAFYEMNPDAYMFLPEDGWFVLQPNHTWNGTGSTDILSIPDILNRIRNDSGEVLAQLIGSADRTTDEGQARHKILLHAIRQISHVAFLKGVACLLKGLYYREGVSFNETRHLFAFTNGVLDLTTTPHFFREIRPEDYITVTCGYDYKAGTAEDKAMVRGFLEKIFPVPLVLEYVLGALARTFMGANTEQWFHVFTGMGANGKSVLMELCKSVFGAYYQTFSVSYLTKEADGKDHPLPEFAAARYARMLVTSEPDERDKFQVNMIKNITGNEEVTFRGMYAKSVTKYVPQFKLWILTNDMPRLSKYDQAIERRMRCVHFPTRFVYAPRAENEALRDDSLSQKFREDEGWRHGLLGLLLDAYSAAPLRMPQEVQEFTEGYMLENNPVGAWLRQHYDITGRRDDVVQKSDLYRAFLDDTGLHKTQKAFADDMVKCNIIEKKTSASRYYIGLIRKIKEE